MLFGVQKRLGEPSGPKFDLAGLFAGVADQRDPLGMVDRSRLAAKERGFQTSPCRTGDEHHRRPTRAKHGEGDVSHDRHPSRWGIFQNAPEKIKINPKLRGGFEEPLGGNERITRLIAQQTGSSRQAKVEWDLDDPNGVTGARVVGTKAGFAKRRRHSQGALSECAGRQYTHDTHDWTIEREAQ